LILLLKSAFEFCFCFNFFLMVLDHFDGIILMHFQSKITLKNNHGHNLNLKHYLTPSPLLCKGLHHRTGHQ